MSVYTTELRFIVEQELDNLNLPNIEDNWIKTYQQIGLDDYPIFQEAYRESLNTKIIRHYYTREICAETLGRWRIFIRNAMYLIMPYYNQMYESEIIAKGMEPLGDHNINKTEHAWGNSENDMSSSADTTTETQNVYQDTPQSEMIPAQIKALQYATNVTLDDDLTKSTAQGKNNAMYDNMVERNENGYSRPQAELLNLYRTTFLNIDRDVVEDLEVAQCFMTIW